MQRKLFLFVFAIFLSAVSPAYAEPAQLVVKQFDGQTFDLAAQRGNVVIVSFWATWCAPCRTEMPILDAAYRRYRGQGLVVIGVSADKSRDRDEAMGRMQGFSYPGAMLQDAQANSLGNPSELPTTIIIDRHGEVSGALGLGPPENMRENLADMLKPLLAERGGSR